MGNQAVRQTGIRVASRVGAGIEIFKILEDKKANIVASRVGAGIEINAFALSSSTKYSRVPCGRGD